MDLCAEHDVVFDCGHVSGGEAIALARLAQSRGTARVRAHCTTYAEAEIAELAALGSYAEFSFFTLTHATQVGLTHVNPEKHRTAGRTIQDVAPRIRAAGNRAILSSDAGVFLLPPPVEAVPEFLLLVESEGFDDASIRTMTTTNPAALFRVPAANPRA